MASIKNTCSCFRNKADVVELKHAYWTGRTSRDNAFAEGLQSWCTEEQRKEYIDREKHKTHCSNCYASFDDRKIVGWTNCPRCGAKMNSQTVDN